MTREKALEWFKDRKKMYLLDDKCQQAEDMAIKALEQEPVLNKIRAEIEEHAKINQHLNTDRARALCWCLDVIDKYKAESELQESEGQGMTREEIIDFCEMKSQLEPENEDIFNYIIKALEQEPCEDAISRQDVWFKLTNGAYDGETTEQFIDRVAKEIESAPPVNPQPKTGHWTRELIRNEKGGCIGAKMICSECNNDNKHDEYMDYCPNCGARMEDKE